MSVIDYSVPATAVILMTDVPLNNKYEDTFYFSSKSEQAAYFGNERFKTITLQQNQFQRHSAGVIRVGLDYKDCYNYNYCVFINVNHENKPYYCFITAVEYLNEHTSLVYYQIDVIQTYMFDWTLNQCLIERQHTESDELFEYLEDEGLQPAEFVDCSTQIPQFLAGSKGYYMNDLGYIVCTTMDPQGKDSTDGVAITSVKNGIVDGLYNNFFVNPESVINYLNNVPGGKLNGIITINCIPRMFVNLNSEQPATSKSTAYELPTYANLNLTDLDGYVPKNKKLFCSQFNFISVMASDGSSRSYKYEYMNIEQSPGQQISLFTLYAALSFPFSCYLAPEEYHSKNSDVNRYTPEYAIYAPPLPTCSWSTDTYKAWYAMNSGQTILNMAVAAVDMVGTVVSYAVGGAAAGAAYTAASNALFSAAPNLTNQQFSDRMDVIDTRYKADSVNAGVSAGTGILRDISTIAKGFISFANAKKVPDAFNGSASSQTIASAGDYGFRFVCRCARADYAKMIDNYFTMYGYKVNRLDTPNINARTRYTFIKTVNCNVAGPIPVPDMDMIENIFNNGIRFWKDTDGFGNYTEENVPNGGLV